MVSGQEMYGAIKDFISEQIEKAEKMGYANGVKDSSQIWYMEKHTKDVFNLAIDECANKVIELCTDDTTFIHESLLNLKKK